MNPCRGATWLVAGLCLLGASVWIGVAHPQAQTAMWKMGLATLAAWTGYWISRAVLGRIDRAGPNGRDLIARAILVAAVIIGVCSGL